MFDDKQTAPGAGTYEIKPKAFKENGNFYMGIKLKDSTKMAVPGAGSYDPANEIVKKRGPSYGMGQKLKSDLVKSGDVPGPGSYANSAEKLKNSSPNYGFGSSTRPDITGGNKFKTPGPGQYKLPTRVADVAEYAYQRDEKAKFV